MHPAVYDWFKTNMQVMAADPGVPFYETLNVMLNQQDLPVMWLTIELGDTAIQRLTVGSPAMYREAGTATAIFVSKAGRGVAPSLVAGQRFVDAIRGDYDGDGFYQMQLVESTGKTGTLRIENVSSPDPAPFEDGNWLLCSVVCAYTYDSFRGAAH